MNSMFNLRNDIGRIIGLLLLCSSGLHFSWLPVSAAEESFTKTSKQNQPLQGAVSIDVSKKTDTLDPVLWPGNYFNKEAATALLNDQARSASIWVKIPAWQAGNWENTQATCTKAVEYKDGQAMEDEPRGVYECKGAFTIGWQRDRNGDVWNRYDTGYWTETDYDDYKAFSYIKSNGPGEADFPDSMNESIVFSVDKLTNKITDVSQEKAWERFLPIAPGIMKEEAVHTAFDEHGNPKGAAWNTALLKRTATIGQYENTASSEKFTNSQIRQDFITFLQHNGLGSLVPPESANNQVIS